MDIKALLAALDHVEGLADNDIGAKLKGLSDKKHAPAVIEMDVTKEAPPEASGEAHTCPACGQPMPSAEAKPAPEGFDTEAK